MSEFHIYKIVWTKEKLDWIIDGTVVRTLTYADAKGGASYPQTPMQVKLGTWVAGKKDAPEGTKEWAGGQADFSNGPSNAYYKKITIVDYQGGAEGAKSYVYGDDSGTWSSIVVDTKNGSLAEQKEQEDDKPSNKTTTSSVSKPTATSTASGSGSGSGSGKTTVQTEVPGSGASSLAVAGSLACVGFLTVLFNLL
jgi:beta-glucanase (GH16 family)